MTAAHKLMRRFLKFHPWYVMDIDTRNADDPKFNTQTTAGREALAKFLRWLVCDKRLEAFDDDGSSPLFTLYAKRPVIGVNEIVRVEEVSFKDENFIDEEFSDEDR